MFRLYPSTHPVQHLYLGTQVVSMVTLSLTSLLFVNRILTLRPNLMTEVVEDWQQVLVLKSIISQTWIAYSPKGTGAMTALMHPSIVKV